MLAAVTRSFAKPVSVAVKGPPSGGKSALVEATFDFFPASAYYALTSMSPMALLYSKESFVHRVLVVYEATGLGHDDSSFHVRSLLTEGHLRHATVISSEKGRHGVVLEKEGPTNLVLTTTLGRLHEDLETRLLSVHVKDTPEQTRRVLLAQAEEHLPQLAFSLSEWREYFEWVAAGDTEVHVDFLKALALSVKEISLPRMKRDHKAVQNLIRAHALMNRGNRLTDDLGVHATINDYEAIYPFIDPIVSEGVGASVSKAVRTAVLAVPQRDDDELGDGYTYSQVARKLMVVPSTAKRLCEVAMQHGWLRNREDAEYRPAQLVRGRPLPNPGEGALPQPAEVRRAYRALVGRDPK